MKTYNVGALAYRHKESGCWACFEYRDSIHAVSLLREFDPLCCIVRDETVLDNSYYDWFYRKNGPIDPNEFEPVELTITYSIEQPIQIAIDEKH